MPSLAVGYARVSTPDQAKADLSLPDQCRSIRAYCDQNGLTLHQIFEEPGVSGREDNRPAFERMVNLAMGPNTPIDVVVVHSYSRFYRDAIELELMVRRLLKHGVKVVSLTQPISDGTTGELTRRMVAIIDEFNSKENAKHTARTMLANAQAGFWNGSAPPLGYRTFVAERRGDQEKKKLEVDPAEADLVRQIFNLYLLGDGTSGPMGVKRIADYLNKRGLRSRRGKSWTAKLVNETLRREAYVGRHFYNVTDSKAGKTRPREEWILVPVPTIVAEGVFDRVQARLSDRNPKMGGVPATSGSPYLLAGIARCGCCGGAMRSAPGKSGNYFYYDCSTKARAGKSACAAKPIRMDELDRLVMNAVIADSLTPTRIADLAEALRSRHLQRSGDLRRELDGARLEMDRANLGIRKLLAQAASGIFEAVADDVKREVDSLQARRVAAECRVTNLEEQMRPARRRISPSRINAFGEKLKELLLNGNVAARKPWLQCFIRQVRIGNDHIDIIGT